MEKNLEALLLQYQTHKHIVTINAQTMAFAKSSEQEDAEPPRLRQRFWQSRAQY
jgi:hypothetical protein